MFATMEQNGLYRLSSVTTFIIPWTPTTVLFLLCVCDNLSALPTRALGLLDGSAEIPIDPLHEEKQNPPVEVTLGRDSLFTESNKTEFSKVFPDRIETYTKSIKERAAADNEACQFLKEISDTSKNGAPILSLGVMSGVILIIQSYPSDMTLKYLCADKGPSSDLANFSSAERSCSLQNITSVYNLTVDIKEPSWIKCESLDRAEILWYELDLNKDSCQRETFQPKLDSENRTDVSLQKTLRVRRYNSFSLQIQNCCGKTSLEVTTVSMTTPTGKHRPTLVITTTVGPEKTSTANNAIIMLMIFIAVIFIISCFIFLSCKICCTPKRRPSYKVEYADPSDVIISSSGAEYSTPYDMCQSRTRVKVSGATKDASVKKRKVSMKKIGRRLTPSRSKGRKRENDSGYSDLLESEASKLSAREDFKEAQYMEIPLANIPVSKTLSNPFYTYVEGKSNGKTVSNKDRNLTPISEPKVKVESETNHLENPYDVLSESDKNNGICDLSSNGDNRNLVENPYAVPDCDMEKQGPKKTQELDNSHESPYSQLKDSGSDEGGPTAKPADVAREDNPYM